MARASTLSAESTARKIEPLEGEERVELIRDALREAHLDALVCSLPSDVLMLTGYWPVVGTAVAIATAGGRRIILAPQDEEELARRDGAEVRTFSPSSLKRLSTPAEALVEPLRQALLDAKVGTGTIGHDGGPVTQPASYAAIHIYGRMMAVMLRQAAPAATFFHAKQVMDRLRAIKSKWEIERIRDACFIAGRAFAEGARELHAGMREVEAAAVFREPLSTAGSHHDARADGFMFCMSGPNAAQAHGAYARSRTRRIEAGDLVLVHCNSYVDGYWTDITRTYCMGKPDARQGDLYEAIFAAREAALKAAQPGAKAKEVDAAARSVLKQRGYEKDFKHSTGHGVGFGAIDPNALPRLHPKSPDVLEPGMVFNIEPGIYLEDFGGIRHCDVVAVSDEGPELLTPFQTKVEELTVL